MANFKFETMTVNLTCEEMWTIMWALCRQIKSCIDNPHYKRYPDSFESNMEDRITLAKQFGLALGRPDIPESSINDFIEWCKKIKKEID